MDYYAQARHIMSILTGTEALSDGVAYPHDNANAGGPSQTDSPFQSPIDPITQSLDAISPTDTSSTNESPINLSPHGDVDHHSYSDFPQVFHQSSDIDHVFNSRDFQVTSNGTQRVNSVNTGSRLEVAYDHNLVLDDDRHDAILERSFPTNTRQGQPFINADPLLQTQFQYNISNVEGQSALCLSLGAVHSDWQNINAGPRFTEYSQHLDVEDGLSPNSSIESDEPQLQATEEAADEKTGDIQTGDHYLIDLRTVSNDFRYRFCIIADNGKGTFRCDLGKCVAGRSSGSFSTLEEIDQHIHEEINSRPFACGYDPCKERFKSRSDCDRHVRSKNKPDAFICEDCGEAFGRKDARKQHVLNRHTAGLLQVNEKPPNEKDQRPKTRRVKKSNRGICPYQRPKSTTLV